MGRSERGRWPDAAEVRALVREARAGDSRAIDALAARIRPGLIAYFTRRLSGRTGRAEDLAQMVLLRFVTALPRIDPERGDQYLATVVQNVLRTEYHRRAKEHRRYVPVELALAVHAPDGLEAHAEYEELARALARAMHAALPPPLRDVLIATLRGERVRDIAARQQVNPVTVRTRLSRARAILRGELAAFLDDRVIPTEQSPRPSPPRSVIMNCCGSTCTDA